MIGNRVLGTFDVGGTTQNSGTAITAFVRPYMGGPGPVPRRLFTVNPAQNLINTPSNLKGVPSWWDSGGAFSHITSIKTINAGTQHTWVIARPLNWTYFTAAIAKNTTAIPNTGLAEDPGVYSTNYRYPTPGGAVPSIADAAISSTNKYVMYQLSDGTWRLDTITSGTFGSSLTLTTGTPNITGVTIPQYSPLFYFGAMTLSDPATALLTSYYPTVSVTETQYDYTGSLWSTYHRGDPIVLYCANATAADILGGAWGVYTRDW